MKKGKVNRKKGLPPSEKKLKITNTRFILISFFYVKLNYTHI